MLDYFNTIIYYLIRKPLFFLWILYRKKYSYGLNNLDKSNIRIDVVICVIEKDLEFLFQCINGVLNNSLNPINDIFIIAPSSDKIIDFCEINNLKFIDEQSILRSNILDKYLLNFNGVSRKGWIYQQLLKLSFDKGECDNFLVIDADHILLKPHLFIDNYGYTYFYQSDEFNFCYYFNNFKLLGLFPSLFSFISHKCLFNKKVLIELQNKISYKSKNPNWILGLLDNININCSASFFSEFECYTSFYCRTKKHNFFPSVNLNISRRKKNNISRKIDDNISCITLPSYLE